MSGYIQDDVLALRAVRRRLLKEAFAKAIRSDSVWRSSKKGIYTKILADRADLLTEIPKYNILREGVLVETVDITPYYTPDWFFLIGCSFSFRAGAHRKRYAASSRRYAKNVAMYNTNVRLTPVDGLREQWS